MTDLRGRLGLILALALAPLLIFSLWQSYYDWKRSQTAIAEQNELTAQATVRQVVDLIGTGKSLLGGYSAGFDLGDCFNSSRSILDNFPQYEYFVVSDNEGRMVCSSRERINTQSSFIDLIAQISPEEPHTVDIRYPTSGEMAGRAIAVVAFGQYTDRGELASLFILGIDLPELQQQVKEESLEGDIELELLNASGVRLYASSDDFPELQQDWLRLAKENRDFTTRITDDQGEHRILTIEPTDEGEMFLAVTSPAQSLLSWNLLNPLASAFVPIFAWAFAFAAIWLAADQMILTHLRRMRESTLLFARGDYDKRIGQLDNPPDSIRELGRTLDLMAERIHTRDQQMQDSLREKTTLLKEIHHRVKNNLQIITSLLNMQERRLTDEAGLQAIVETRNRINAIALVHKELYEGEDLEKIDMVPFTRALVKSLGEALGADDLNVETRTRIEVPPVISDVAITLGLFIVEAMTNSIKHGVPQGGWIEIQLLEEDGSVYLNILDSGPGIIQTDTFKGLGQKLMVGFARQLGGEFLTGTADDGFVFRLKFPAKTAGISEED